MPGRWPLPGILERAVEEVHLARPVRTREGHRRAAAGAKVALHAGRGGIAGGLALEVAKLLEPHADIGRQRRGHGAPAARAMAMHDPLRRALELVLDGAALAAAPGGRHRRNP